MTADTVSVKEGDVVKAGATLVTFTDGSVLQSPVDGTITSLSIASGDSVQISEQLHTSQITVHCKQLLVLMN